MKEETMREKEKGGGKRKKKRNAAIPFAVWLSCVEPRLYDCAAIICWPCPPPLTLRYHDPQTGAN